MWKLSNPHPNRNDGMNTVEEHKEEEEMREARRTKREQQRSTNLTSSLADITRVTQSKREQYGSCHSVASRKKRGNCAVCAGKHMASFSS